MLGALAGPRLSSAAALARRHLVEAGVVEPPWAESLGAPRLGECWVYGDDFGDQESLVLTFAYGRKKDAVCVLIDHNLGGGVKDAYVSVRVPTLRQQMFEAAEDDPPRTAPPTRARRELSGFQPPGLTPFTTAASFTTCVAST
ncbi:MAG: hypothetical protein ACYDGN_12490 [Acidimicrobiales bacterium]